MRRAPVVVFGLLLATPLFTWPGTGFDSVRLPVALGLACALLAIAFVRAARGGGRPPGPPPLGTDGLLLLGVPVPSLLAARSVAEGVIPILILLAGVSVFACLRAGVVPRESADGFLRVIVVVALIVGAFGVIQKVGRGEAVSFEGNRNYSGALAAMLLPVTVAL